MNAILSLFSEYKAVLDVLLVDFDIKDKVYVKVKQLLLNPLRKRIQVNGILRELHSNGCLG